MSYLRQQWFARAAWCLLLLAPLLPTGLLVYPELLRASDVEQGLRALLPVLVHVAILACFWAALGRSRRLVPLLLVYALLAPAELFYEWQFGVPSGVHLYGVMLDSTAEEVWSMFGASAGKWLLVVLCWVAVLAVSTRLAWRHDRAWRGRTRAWVLGAGVAAAGLWGYVDVVTREPEDLGLQKEERHLIPQLMSPGNEGALAQLEQAYLTGLPLRLAQFYEHRQLLNSHQTHIAGFDFGVQPSLGGASSASRKVTVLVLGESSRQDRWQLYGAARATNPLLMSRRDELLLFKDVVSPASATRESVPLMLTRRPPGKHWAASREPSVVTIFRQAGFKSYWFSNQGAAGRHETPISVIAREADEQRFINGADYRVAGSLDGALLPLLDGALREQTDKKFIVLHTLGSHQHYANRYSTAFEHFKPALQPHESPDVWEDTQKEMLINAYDNTLVYTDYFVNEVLNRLQALDAEVSLVFVSDHGEVIFDGHCEKAAHGFAAKANYRVPFIVWANERWKQKHPATWHGLERNRDEALSALGLTATLLDMAGVQISMPHGYPSFAGTRTRWPMRHLNYFGDFDGSDFQRRACDLVPAPAAVSR